MPIMIDFAAKDKRSVSAMLRGDGDGREKNFLKFRADEILREPVLTEDEIADLYQTHSHAEYYREKNKVINLSHFWLRDVALN